MVVFNNPLLLQTSKHILSTFGRDAEFLAETLRVELSAMGEVEPSENLVAGEVLVLGDGHKMPHLLDCVACAGDDDFKVNQDLLSVELVSECRTDEAGYVKVIPESYDFSDR